MKPSLANDDWLFFLEVCVVLLFHRFVSYWFFRLKYPRLLGDLLAGILAGPTIWGAYINNIVFPSRNKYIIQQIGFLGVILMSLVAGANFDRRILRQRYSSVIIFSFFNNLFPLIFAIPAYYFYGRPESGGLLQQGYKTSETLVIACVFAASSLPVMFMHLEETKLNLAWSRFICCLDCVSSFFLFLLLSIATSFDVVDSDDVGPTIGVRLGAMLGLVFALLLMQRVWIWCISRFGLATWASKPTTDFFLIIVALAVISAVITDMLGFSCMLGSFLVGMCLPFNEFIRNTLTQHVRWLTRWLLLPAYLLDIGLNFDLRQLNGRGGGFIVLFLFWGLLSKMPLLPLAKHLLKLSWRDAIFCVILQSARGFNALICAKVALDAGIFNQLLYTSSVLLCLVSNLITLPLTVRFAPTTAAISTSQSIHAGAHGAAAVLGAKIPAKLAASDEAKDGDVELEDARESEGGEPYNNRLGESDGGDGGGGGGAGGGAAASPSSSSSATVVIDESSGGILSSINLAHGASLESFAGSWLGAYARDAGLVTGTTDEPRMVNLKFGLFSSKEDQAKQPARLQEDDHGVNSLREEPIYNPRPAFQERKETRQDNMFVVYPEDMLGKIFKSVDGLALPRLVVQDSAKSVSYHMCPGSVLVDWLFHSENLSLRSSAQEIVYSLSLRSKLFGVNPHHGELQLHPLSVNTRDVLDDPDLTIVLPMVNDEPTVAPDVEHFKDFSTDCELAPILFPTMDVSVPRATVIGKTDLIENEDTMRKLLGSVPEEFQLRPWVLSYSIDRDGASLKRFYEICEKARDQGDSQGAMLIIRDETGRVFGGFSSQTWRPEPPKAGLSKQKMELQFYGTHACFVFLIDPKTGRIRKFSSKGKNKYWQQSTDEKISLGGGNNQAILLDKSFRDGFSGPCETFGSPRLSTESAFVCHRLELWTPSGRF